MESERKINPRKQALLSELKKHLENYSLFLITSIEDLPALLLQRIRKDVKGKALIKIVKRRILLRLFEEEANKDEKYLEIADFCRNLKQSCAIIFSENNLFSLLKILQKRKEKKKVRPGIAKEDIVIPAGNTGLMAGPILAELSDAGIKAGLEKGKVVIKETFMVKKGEYVSETLASVLEKLNILPITAKLRPLIAYDKNSHILFNSEVLEFDAEKQITRLKEAYLNALSLSLEIKYFTKESIIVFLQEAYLNSQSLQEMLNKKI